MKKLVFVILFMILATIMYGQAKQIFTTSDGFWSCQIEYIGRNEGQENAELFSFSYNRVERLSNVQIGYVRTMLNYYEHGRSDTFYLTLSYWPRYWNYDFPSTSVMVIVEYNTNTEWVYWAYNLLSGR